MSECRIILENYPGVYYAGTEIKGQIESIFTEDTTVRGIKIRLLGTEYNEWTGTETYNEDNKQNTRTVQFTGENQILFIEHLLHDSSHSGSGSIPAGRHVFPISILLPTAIPSSFNGRYGSIQYKLKAIVDRPMQIDYEDEYKIKVFSPINFNLQSQHLQESSAFQDEKTVCCWCCAGGHIIMDVAIEKTALVPGESVILRVHIKNLSNESVENLCVKLEQKLRFRVTSPSDEDKTEVIEILRLTEHGVGANGEHTFDLTLDIPSTFQVPNFTRCRLFESSYFLEVRAKMPTCSSDLEVLIYPELGHIQASRSQASAPGLAAGVGGSSMSYPPNAAPYPTIGFTGGDMPPPFPEKTPYPAGPPTAPNFTSPQASAPELSPPSYEDI